MKYKKIMIAMLALIVLLALVLVAFFIGDREQEKEKIKITQEYTWTEFEAMDGNQQMEFQNSFDNPKDFEEWMNEAQKAEEEAPWEKGGKVPEDYTWAEFEALAPDMQMKFQNSFDTEEDFEKWMDSAQNGEVDLPWEKGGKIPQDYTWEEFEALTPEQQRAFQEAFDSTQEFESWMVSVQNKDVDIPWEDNGKAPEDYTWEEFEDLSPDEQMAFQNSFESSDEFEEWMEKAQSGGSDEKWNEGGDLFDVTWEEFEAMSMEEQMLFQKSFGSIEGFEKWLEANEP